MNEMSAFFNFHFQAKIYYWLLKIRGYSPKFPKKTPLKIEETWETYWLVECD